MKKVKMGYVALGLCLVILGFYAASAVLYVRANWIPDWRPQSSEAASLAILADTPTPTAGTGPANIETVPGADGRAASSNDSPGFAVMPTSTPAAAALSSAASDMATKDKAVNNTAVKGTGAILLPTVTPTDAAVYAAADLAADLAAGSSEDAAEVVLMTPIRRSAQQPAATPLPDAVLAPAMGAASVAQNPSAVQDVADLQEEEPAARASAFNAPGPAQLAGGCQITSPPTTLGLDPFYSKYCSALGLPVIASAEVPDLALQRTWKTIIHMLDGIAQAEEITNAMTGMASRVALMGVQQVPTDMPEYHNLYTLFPGIDWNTRTRGIGATQQIPLLAVGEENILCYEDDMWVGQNVLVHEFAHAIKNMGIDVVNPSFHAELERVYQHALDSGLWAGTYAASNVEEYWAEGVRIYFRADGEPNAPGGQSYPANTRVELQSYDPDLYQIIAEIFGPRPAITRCS